MGEMITWPVGHSGVREDLPRQALAVRVGSTYISEVKDLKKRILT